MEPTERFAELVARPQLEIGLDEAALLIAAHAHPGLAIDDSLAALDRLAEECDAPTLDGVRRLLFRDLGFRGNRDDYHDPRNSFLDDVLERRLGIPISLCVLTIEVGRRVGAPMAGVGMPGHFLVRDRVDPSVFVDPYRGGVVLDAGGCRRVFHSVHGPDATFDPTYLDPVGPLVVIARMLANLKAIYARRGDQRSLAWVLGLRCLIPDMPIDEYAEWANALASSGHFREAAEVLESAAERIPDANADAWRDTAVGLRARLN
jgi:regulator of sirC expression with transglutaminase-like and TPR domain